MAIFSGNVLPLKAIRLDAIAKIKCFGGSGTPAIQFRWFYLHSLCGATLFTLQQRHLSPSIWQFQGDKWFG